MTSRTDKGFTLVELLVVIVIIGVMAMIIGPTFTSGSDIARVKTASRGFMQMSRYARTMALLHQTPLELVFTSDGGLRVASVGGGGEGVVSAKAFAITNSADEAAGADVPADGAPGVAQEGDAAGGGAAYVMADLAIDKKYEQVGFTFEGYTDTWETGGLSGAGALSDESEEEDSKGERLQTSRIRYKSNGTCRPYKVKIAAEGDAAYAVIVAVDMLGAAKVEEDE